MTPELRPALRRAVPMLLGAFVLGVGAAPAPPEQEPGGATTVAATGRSAFSSPAANLSDAERTRFAYGNSFFRRNWVEAPASTAARDGLGPHYIARSCAGCHAQGGRGEPPDWRRGAQEQPRALLLRLSVPGTGGRGEAKPVPEPTYGEQFNNLAVPGVRAEGEITLRYSRLHGRFSDGTRYTLHKPIYGFRQLAYGPMAADVMISPRIAQQLIGAGLIEAIPDEEILRNAEHQAQAPGPIKGQPNRVWDVFAQRTMLGRFGWKANVATLAHQTAAAFVGDIGITSAKFPDETCTARQADCLAAPHGAQGRAPEIDDATLGHVVFFQAAIAPPARRAARDLQVLRGEKLFAGAQCAVCHRPNYVTTQGPFPSLSSGAVNRQSIWPHTDLLLHDMGEDLADGRPDFLANGRQWKTPPLWGIGLMRAVNGHQRLLHDGRADGVLEAILWHGGEAEASRRQVLRMNRGERDALIKFVESL